MFGNNARKNDQNISYKAGNNEINVKLLISFRNPFFNIEKSVEIFS